MKHRPIQFLYSTGICIHGKVAANQKPVKDTRLSIPSVLNRPVASGTCLSSRFDGNVVTESLPR
jgi:hypothetical protein